MASEAHPGAKLLEELDLAAPQPTPPKQQPSCFWKWRRPLALLEDVRRRRSRCVVCLQVHQVSGLPPCMDGRALAVGWRTRGWKGELTLPAHVRGGSASFEEIFLHYRHAHVRSTMQSFTIWVSLMDAGDCDLGTFDVDLGGLVSTDNGSSKFGGKTVALDLSGMANGGVLRVSVYYRVMEGEVHGLQKHSVDPHGAGQQSTKCWCFPRLPDVRHRRTRPVTVSARRIPSVKSDPGFITIENAVLENPYPTDDEDESFITIEKGRVRRRARSKRPPSSNSFDIGDDDGAGAKPFLTEAAEEFDVDRVEDEFLKMLEEKAGKECHGGEVEKEDEETLKLSFDMDLDLESLVRAAEMELSKAARAWRGSRRVGGAALEKEEHEELVKRWRAGAQLPSSNATAGSGFGSPT